MYSAAASDRLFLKVSKAEEFQQSSAEWNLILQRQNLLPEATYIEIACIFGGATLIVPDDWNIIIQVTPILGGFSDSRKLIPGRM